MPKMNKLYLQHLSFICKTHHDNGTRFDLNMWIGDFGPNTRVDGWCGTQACAVGHAMLDPYFNRAGFCRAGAVPSYNGSRNWDAVVKFFGISGAAAVWVFSADSYGKDNRSGDKAARLVASRIDRLVTHGEKIVPKKYIKDAVQFFGG